ncbi:hypothetical protein KKH43_06225 [Patescibacteria group bacterium]|nr:hypothetical protein [Patescibacteria group bacterium]
MIRFIAGFILIVLLTIGGVIGYAAYTVKKDVGVVTYKTFKDYYVLKLRQDLTAEEKESLRGAVTDAKYKVYEEATEHNPEGDMLPDEIDDTLKEKVKEELR